MIEHYVTLFDRGFLANGLALHASMQRHAGDFVLWVVCMDDQTHDLLSELDLPTMQPIRLAEVETEELREVKAQRSRVEYCWTLTPFTPDFVFERARDAERATYIDADMCLAHDPTTILDELERSGASALLTEHAYAPAFEQAAEHGIYCVQFMPFERERSRDIRQWWQDRVIEWCFATPSQGRFGDQKYLDDWPERFGALVHVLAEPQWTQAPWNATRFDVRDAITYHFHQLRTVSSRRVLVGLYPLPKAHIRLFYLPYLRDLRRAYRDLAALGYEPSPQSGLRSGWRGIKDRIAFRVQGARRLRTPRTLNF